MVLSWIIALDTTIITLFDHGYSWKDIILIAGGLFLIYKATHEMHAEIEEPHEPSLSKTAGAAFSAIIVQIIIIDMVFSVDSIITAVGMVEHVEVMIAAVVVAVGLMFVASGPIASFVAKHPTTKMLALAFLLMIGLSLAADGLGFHIERATSTPRWASRFWSKPSTSSPSSAGQCGQGASPQAVHEAAAATVPASIAAEAISPSKPKSRSTPAARAHARPKSAPRKKG